MAKRLVVAIPDLMLQSRVTEAAKRLGVDHAVASDPEELFRVAKGEAPSLILLDLESPRMQADKTLHRIRADAELCAVPTLGLYGHKNKALADAMVQAGCDRVMTRGDFTGNVEAVLRPFAD